MAQIGTDKLAQPDTDILRRLERRWPRWAGAGDMPTLDVAAVEAAFLRLKKIGLIDVRLRPRGLEARIKR